MADKGSVSMSLDKLEALAESLKTRPEIQVGVFTGGAKKNGSTRKPEKGSARNRLTNADLAAIHEYGAPSVGIPARSMLKIPITDHAAEIVKGIRGKGEEYLKTKGAPTLWKLVGIACEKVVSGAFSSGGYGKWAPLKRATLMRKEKGSLAERRSTVAKILSGEAGMEILIDTGQLRRAFSSRVVMKY